MGQFRWKNWQKRFSLLAIPTRALRALDEGSASLRLAVAWQLGSQPPLRYEGVWGSLFTDSLRCKEVEKKIRITYKPDAKVFQKDTTSFRIMAMAMWEDTEFHMASKSMIAATGSPVLNLKRPLYVEEQFPRRELIEFLKGEDRITLPRQDGRLENEEGAWRLSNCKPTCADLAHLDLLLASMGKPSEGFEWHQVLHLKVKQDWRQFPSQTGAEIAFASVKKGPWLSSSLFMYCFSKTYEYEQRSLPLLKYNHASSVVVGPNFAWPNTYCKNNIAHVARAKLSQLFLCSLMWSPSLLCLEFGRKMNQC